MKRAPILAAITITTTAVFAFGSVGTAEASSPGYGNLCEKNSTYCALSNGVGGLVDSVSFENTYNSNGVNYMTNWYYPTSGSGYGLIQQANTNTCMELTSGGDIYGATCNSSNGDQEWKVVDFDSSNNVGDLQNEGHTSLCLTNSGPQPGQDDYGTGTGIFTAEDCLNDLPQQFVVG
jgi:hypothetical protein